MENLINYLLRFGQLTQPQIDLVKSKISVVELTKEDYFSKARKVPEQVAFISKGILRAYYYNNEGEQITKYFSDENNFAVDINCFNQKIPSSEYVQAVTDCTLFVFSRENFIELSGTILAWDTIVNKIISKALSEKINKLSPMVSQNAKNRYLQFLEKFPTLANRVPLAYLASYLGITPSTLSRVRKKIY